MDEQEDRDRLRYLQLKKKQAASAPPQEKVAGPEPQRAELGGVDTARGALQSFNEGTALGFSDEIAGLGRTMLERLTMPEAEYRNPDTQSFNESYEMYRDDERKNVEQFAGENPVAATALEIGGAVASPANFVGGGATSLPRAIARASGEGGVVGAGKSDDMAGLPLSIAKGAAAGGATAGALSAPLRLFGRKNISSNLVDEAGDFTPIHMSEPDNLLADFYRQGVGRTYGGGEVLRRQQKPIMEAAEDLAERATAKVAGVKRGVETGLKSSIKKLDDDAAREAVEAAIPGTMPRKVAAKARSAKTVDEAEEIVSKFWRDDAFKAIESYSEIPIPKTLLSSLKRKVTLNPELKEALGPGAMKQIKAMVEKGEVSGAQLMEMRNMFARAANKTPSLKGKGSREIANYFDNIIKNNVDDMDWKILREELDTWGGKQALSKSARAARKAGRDITTRDVARNASDRGGLQQAAGRKIRQQADLSEAAKSRNINESPKVVAAQSQLDEATAGLSKTRGKQSPQKATGLSEFFTTSLFGGGIAPLGVVVSKALARPGMQKALAGQTGVQSTLRKAIESGNEAAVSRILARLAASAQTGE